MPPHALAVLQDSNLNPFLFAEVGSEINGSRLTILSMLARLGEDPWARAATWSSVPSSAAAVSLAADIRKMPLVLDALRDAESTAARLVLLLPRKIMSTDRHVEKIRETSPLAKRAALAVIGLCIIFWLIHALTMGAAPGRPPPSPIAHAIAPGPPKR